MVGSRPVGLNEAPQTFKPFTKIFNLRMYFIWQKTAPYSLPSQFEKVGGL